MISIKVIEKIKKIHIIQSNYPLSYILLHCLGHIMNNKIKNLLQRNRLGKITNEHLLNTLSEKDILSLFLPSFYEIPEPPLATGSAFSIGAVVGKVVFKLDENTPENSILICEKLSADQIIYFKKVAGIIAQKEERSSHAVIVTRSMAKPLMAEISSFKLEKDSVIIGGKAFYEGDSISLDCFNNHVYGGKKELQTPVVTQETTELLEYLAAFSPMKINGNSDTHDQAKYAKSFGAYGIEPRSEHMFFSKENLRIFRTVILSDKLELESELITQIKQIQFKEFYSLLSVCKDKPLVIRLFDPPMHEFLPHEEEEIHYFSMQLGISVDELQERIELLKEVNPMMGNRGARLLITKPQLIDIQLSPLFQAALMLLDKGKDINLWISIPMIIDKQEIKTIKKAIQNVYCREVISQGKVIDFKIGVMIETPRSALLSHEIAPEIDFISFGTNDLTAQTFCFSRGDSYHKYLNHYLNQKILPFDPFYEVDRAVEELIKITVERVRSTNPDIHIGLCGEQGAQETTVQLCHKLGFNSISCNANKIPSVVLFAARAALNHNNLN